MSVADESIDLSSTIESNTEIDEETAVDTDVTTDDVSPELQTDAENMMIPVHAKEQLVAGILETYEPDFRSVHDRVKELMQNQGVLLDSTQNELTALSECTMLKEIAGTFENLKTYQKKLTMIKKDMGQLLDRSHKAKLRAHKLQIQKQKDDLAVALEKEKQMKYEKELMAKPAVEYQPNT